MKHLGIDPGATGAWSLMAGEYVVDVFDLPTEKVRVGKAMRNRLVPAALCQAWRMRLSEISHAFVEEAGTRKGEGPVGAFACGRNFGEILGVLTGLGIPYTLVRPAPWKKALGISADKGAARMRACQLWPGMADRLTRVKDHNRAEACLIGLYGAKRDFTAASVEIAFGGGHAAA